MFESLKRFGLEARYDGSLFKKKGRNIGFLRINMQAVAYPFCILLDTLEVFRPLIKPNGYLKGRYCGPFNKGRNIGFLQIAVRIGTIFIRNQGAPVV